MNERDGPLSFLFVLCRAKVASEECLLRRASAYNLQITRGIGKSETLTISAAVQEDFDGSLLSVPIKVNAVSLSDFQCIDQQGLSY